MAAMKIVGALLVCLLVVAAPVAESALGCGVVARSLAPCLGYLRGTGGLPPTCCSGVRALNNAARTTPDRQSACSCLKNTASSIRDINLNLASGLPAKCGINIPYKISPSTDCSKVR